MSKKNDESLDFSALFKDATPVNHDRYILGKDEGAIKRQKEKAQKLAKKRASAQGLGGLNDNLSTGGHLSTKAYIQNAATIALSDTFEAHWPQAKAIKYFRAEDSSKVDNTGPEALAYRPKDILKKLSMGHYPPDIEVDLHGLTSKQAKAEILAVIFEAKKRHFACVSILHGHGTGTLKRKIPNWLVQHPDVAAFVQAPRAFGGKAGLLVLIGIDFQAFKPD